MSLYYTYYDADLFIQMVFLFTDGHVAQEGPFLNYLIESQCTCTGLAKI